MEGSRTFIYLGAVPPTCDTSKQIDKLGLAFATDGTVRFCGERKEGCDTTYKDRCFLQSSDVMEELELRYDQPSKSVELWRLLPTYGERASKNKPIQVFHGVPPSWRFAVGLEDCYVELRLLELPRTAPSLPRPAPPPPPPAPPAAPTPNIADVQRNAAAAKVQALYRGQQGKNEANERRLLKNTQQRFLTKRESCKEARTVLDAASDEYKEVASYFLARLAPTERSRCALTSIEKLYVADILEQYEVLVKQMVRRENKRRDAGKEAIEIGGNGESIELAWVFHACAADAVDNIICGGFNRSYAGKNATLYGPGVYFARDSSYSARHTYSPPDENDDKRIFMCRLALGAHTPVPQRYDEREPPVRDADRLLGVGVLRYDTTTDNSPQVDGIPGIMVAFKDNQAYAEYLVTFRWLP